MPTERITPKLTRRTLIYDDHDDIGFDGDDMSAMIRRRSHGAFAKNNNNNDDGDKSSIEDDDDTRK